jgi:hypothetical protein
MVKMTKADLQNAPEFRYSTSDANRAGAAGNTNPTRRPSILLATHRRSPRGSRTAHGGGLGPPPEGRKVVQIIPN